MMLRFLFLNYWLILFNSCGYYTNVYSNCAELVIPIGIPTKEAKAEMEAHPVIVEASIRKCSI